MSNIYPSDWSYGELSKSGVDILDGDRGKEYPKEADFFENEHCLFLSAKNVTKSGFKFEHKAFITREKDEKLRKGKLIRNDLVVTTRGTVGNVAYFDGTVPFENIRINSGMAIIRNVDSQIDSIFLNQLLHSFIVDEQLELLTSGSAQPQLTIGTIKGLVIPFPPLPEQQKIAKILTSVDDAIEKTQAQIDKLKDLKTGMMQELLTSGIGHTEFKDSPVGRIPAEWEVDILINLSTNGINNGIFNDPKKVGKGYKLINVVEMYRGFGVDVKTLKLQDCNEKTFNKNKVEYGDVFFTRSSLKLEGIAFCNINLSHDNDITYDGHLMRVRPDVSRVLPNYLAYYCLSDFARKSFMANAKHSTMTTIGQADIAPLSVSLPPIEEQEEIIKHLDSVENNIRIKNSKLEHNKRIKKALMQDLLTGKVRVDCN